MNYLRLHQARNEENASRTKLEQAGASRGKFRFYSENFASIAKFRYNSKNFATIAKISLLANFRYHSEFSLS